MMEGLRQLRYLLGVPLRAGWSRERMARFRDAQFRWTVRHAAATIPLYRGMLRKAGVDPGTVRGVADRQRLPIVTRDALRAAGEDAWATDLPPSRRWMSSTSGSSGDPLILLYDRGERVLAHAVNFHCETLYGWRPWHRAMAVGSQFVAPQGTWWQRIGLLRWLWVDPALPVRRWLEISEDYRPQVLRIYPSALREFCAEVRRRGALRWRPGVVAAVGELYPPELDPVVREVFGTAPVVVYGAMEAGRIAFSCRPGAAMHVRMDAVDVELLRDGRPADSGVGEVFLTSLLFCRMPLIRYRLGDLAEWEPALCDCGLWWPRLRMREGRGSEVLRLPDGRRVPITRLGGVIGQVPGLRQYQFVQTAPTRLVVRYSLDGHEGLMTSALRAMEAMLPGVQVLAERCERIGHTATGKVTRFVRQSEAPGSP